MDSTFSYRGVGLTVLCCVGCNCSLNHFVYFADFTIFRCAAHNPERARRGAGGTSRGLPGERLVPCQHSMLFTVLRKEHRLNMFSHQATTLLIPIWDLCLIPGVPIWFQVFRKPWPGIMRGIYQNQERFQNTYFKKFPGFYVTGDGKFTSHDDMKRGYEGWLFSNNGTFHNVLSCHANLQSFIIFY